MLNFSYVYQIQNSSHMLDSGQGFDSNNNREGVELEKRKQHVLAECITDRRRLDM